MPPYLPAVVSFLSAVLSLIFFLLNFRLNRKVSDRSTAIDGHKLLLELDKQLISDPRLWALQDDHPLPAVVKGEPCDPLLAGKLEAFAYMTLNTFEILLAFHPCGGETRGNAEYETWRRFFGDTLAKSSRLRQMLEDPEVRSIYGAELLAEHTRLIARQNSVRT